jgi:hypothetical protein
MMKMTTMMVRSSEFRVQDGRYVLFVKRILDFGILESTVSW